MKKIIFALGFVFLFSTCKKDIPQKQLTVNVTPDVGGTVSPIVGTYAMGSTVKVLATPSLEYVFKEWTGGFTGTENPANILMDIDKTVTAVFEKREYPLSLKIVGSGTVKEEIIKIASASTNYKSGTTVRLTPQPSDGYEFKGWSGDDTTSKLPLDIVISKAINLTCIFDKEEDINFKTNLDTGTYNVIDTLPLVITVSSKLPKAGILYSIMVNWTDSSKQIFKLDTNLSVSILNLNIPGLKKSGTYSLSVTVTSRSTVTNTLKKSISVLNNPLGRFKGYKVDMSLKSKDEINYWRDCGLIWDVVMYKFGQPVTGTQWNAFMPQIIVGDFNNDGWIDIFNPGTGSFDSKVWDNAQWLIWNPNTRSFENKKLFNDKTIQSFGGNQRRSIAYDINKDGFTDVVIFDHGDDVVSSNPLQPIRIVLSDGKGGYDLKDLNNITSTLKYNHSGDIADLNKDGYPDLVVGTGDMYISWGIPTFPYFGSNVTYFNIWDNNNKNKGGGGVYNIKIADVNKDGWLDIIEGSNENNITTNSYLPFTLSSRILYNQGNGKFDNNAITFLPFYMESALNNDFRVFDFDGDGLNDIISTGSVNYDNFFFHLYIQNKDGSFAMDNAKIIYSINSQRSSGKPGSSWKPWLIFYDFNSDGLPDFSYIDPHNYWNNSLSKKSVFIRTGNQFKEDDIYKYDIFLNSIKPK